MDGQDVALLRAEIVDSNGVRVASATNNVTFTVVSGPGRIVGSHNGDPTTHVNNHSPMHPAYHGLVRGVVMVTEDRASPAWHRQRLRYIDVDGNKNVKIVEPGTETDGANDVIVVSASSPGLATVTVSIACSTDAADSVLAVASQRPVPLFADQA